MNLFSFLQFTQGQQKLKRNASSKPPKFGCPIPNWGALNGECPRSRFVAQIPMDSPAARMVKIFYYVLSTIDAALGALPSYFQ